MMFSHQKGSFLVQHIYRKRHQEGQKYKNLQYEIRFKKSDTHFELIQIEVQCYKNYFEIFLPQKVGAFGSYIEKEPQRPRPKLKKCVY